MTRQIRWKYTAANLLPAPRQVNSSLTGPRLPIGRGDLFAGPHLVREEYRVALLIGLLGAFTTFSTFGWETFKLMDAGQLWLAGLNIVLSNGAGLFAVVLGYRLGTKWFGA